MSFFEEIKKIKNITINEDFNFGRLKSTFKVDGIVKYYIHTNDLSSLKKVSKILFQNNLKYTPIGGGSNILINKFYDGIFLEYTDDRILEFIDKDDDFIIRVFAGVPKSQLLQKSIDLELSGLEFLAGIPGKVGGGIAMNAGAYGSDFEKVMKRVAVCHNGNGVFYNVKDLNIKYRNFNFPQNPYMITFADILLEKSDKNEIQEKIQKNLIQKKETQPLEYPSAGSIFKNPKTQGQKAEKPAWWYILESGLAGTKKGGAEISNKHANFIINTNNASSSDILYLINLAKQEVKKRFNIDLKEEVQIYI